MRLEFLILVADVDYCYGEVLVSGTDYVFLIPWTWYGSFYLHMLYIHTIRTGSRL